jgi:hypothetical protein
MIDLKNPKVSGVHLETLVYMVDHREYKTFLHLAETYRKQGYDVSLATEYYLKSLFDYYIPKSRK